MLALYPPGVSSGDIGKGSPGDAFGNTWIPFLCSDLLGWTNKPLHWLQSRQLLEIKARVTSRVFFRNSLCFSLAAVNSFFGTASDAVPFFWCARHGVDVGGGSPLQALMTGTDSGRQLRRREAGWGGSWKQSSELTNRNRIRGRCGGVTRPWTGKPNSHSDTRIGKSGGDRAKDQRLTLGDLFVSPAIGVGRRQRRPMDGEKSAEAIIVRATG